MMRTVYILLLRMHPAAFKQRFGDEMLGIFDESAEKGPLMVDLVRSLMRQRMLRPRETPFPVTATADGVPLFYSGEREIPPTSALMRGAVVAFFLFGSISLVMSHRWKQAGLMVGSHHPSPSNILPARADAQPVADLPTEVKVKPYVSRPSIAPYFRLLLVLGALDADEDNAISAAEIENAPAALRTLDRDHDGILSAEECGLKPDARLDAMGLGRARLNFMRIHPVLAALDVNHDGVISESEIRNSAAALRTLDANRDGKLMLGELLPDRPTAMAAGIMEMFDRNGDGRITRDEMPAAFAEGLLDRADEDGKGFVTEEDLVRELMRRK